MVVNTIVSTVALLFGLASVGLAELAQPGSRSHIQHRHHELSARNLTSYSNHTERGLEQRGITWRFKYGSDRVRGVNLGGWLVLEPFITPGLFKATGDDRIVDEYTFCQYQSYDKAHKALVKHWDTWITESDIKAIKAAGLNHVRIPIGYWAYDTSAGEPYHKGADAYLRKAIGWAANAGLKVWIDLHGAPGSQNGFDNSGQRISYPLWHTKKSNVDRTSAIVKMLAKEYSQSKYPHVTAIAPLNEPAGFRGNDVVTVTKQYWYDSYGNIRHPPDSKSPSNLIEVIHDTFQPLNSWRNFANYPQYDGVILDTHMYEVFSDAEVSRTWDQHIASVCSKGNSINSFVKSSGSLWTVVGEWSLAAYDCALWLNGRGIGARYDGTYPGSKKIGSCSTFTGDGTKFSSSYKTFLRKYWEAQAVAYSKGNGWIYWTWKTEGAAEWSYSAGLKYGWIPKNPTERKYPGLCG